MMLEPWPMHILSRWLYLPLFHDGSFPVAPGLYLNIFCPSLAFPFDSSLKGWYFFGLCPGSFCFSFYTYSCEISSTPVASVYLQADDAQVHRSVQNFQIVWPKAEMIISPFLIHLKTPLHCPFSQTISSLATKLFDDGPWRHSWLLPSS